MKPLLFAATVVAALTFPVVSACGDDGQSEGPDNWLEAPTVLAAAGDGSPAPDPAAAGGAGRAAEKPKSSPPLPLHCIEGYSGGPITPLAYICNTEKKEGMPDWLGLPTVAYSFVNIGSKELHVVSVTQPFLDRFEFGYAYNNLDTGSLYDDIRDAGLDMGESHIGLHHFNLRAMLLKEDSFDLPLPAVTAGIHFKYNDAIEDIDQSLGGAFTNIGYDDDFGIDYTLTATKMFPKLAFGRPVIVTGGLRFSKGSQLGLLGFDNECTLTVEGNVVYLPVDQLALAYEYRMKENPYDDIPGLVEGEDDWHVFSANWIINDHLTLTGLYGTFGTIANGNEDCVLGVQVKYEF